MEPVRLPGLIVFFLSTHSALGSYPTAQNITWKSTNFKTILTWGPEPSANYSYTVDFSSLAGNKLRSPHCIRSSRTMCDLSNYLTDLQADYTADVLSEPPMGVGSEINEPSYSTSPRFCPYKDTDISSPEFKLEVSEDKKTTTLYVTDPLTAVFEKGRQLNIRDIFSDQLQYKVIYRKNKSTGKKELKSKINVIELTGLDQGVSYCFSVQAYIPTRSIDKQLGELSQTQCSNDDNQSIFEVYSMGVIAAAIFLILLLIGIIIAATLVCYTYRKKALKKEKEAVPLQDV